MQEEAECQHVQSRTLQRGNRETVRYSSSTFDLRCGKCSCPRSRRSCKSRNLSDIADAVLVTTPSLEPCQNLAFIHGNDKRTREDDTTPRNHEWSKGFFQNQHSEHPHEEWKRVIA